MIKHLLRCVASVLHTLQARNLEAISRFLDHMDYNYYSPLVSIYSREIVSTLAAPNLNFQDGLNADHSLISPFFLFQRYTTGP